MRKKWTNGITNGVVNEHADVDAYEEQDGVINVPKQVSLNIVDLFVWIHTAYPSV
jgi:hypothetical protein